MQRQLEEARRALEDLGQAAQQLAAKQRRDLVGQLNQTFRRLRSYRGEAQWISAVLDASEAFCSRCAVFVVNSGRLEWKSARGFEIGPISPSFALADAAAFSAAVESRDITVALCTAWEVSSALTHVIGEDTNRKITLVPIVAMDRVAAVLYAEDADAAGLELVCVMAGMALDANARKPSPNPLQQIAPAAAAAPPVSVPDEDIHLRARRFARRQAAEIRLYEPEAVKSGRASGNLYQGVLKIRIDQAREAFRNQFAANASTIDDHLHEELVRVLANGNARLLEDSHAGRTEEEQDYDE